MNLLRYYVSSSRLYTLGEMKHMFVARFSYAFRPVDRDRVIALVRQEVEAARTSGWDARLLVPLTRASGGASLQFEVEVPNLDAFEGFREEGMGGERETRTWIRELSELLLEPPAVELLRIAEGNFSSS
jgi:hypothetical protein